MSDTHPIHKNVIRLEFHQLDRRYQQLRQPQEKRLTQLITSIRQAGQLVPVVVVQDVPQHYILIDGYLRCEAMKHCGYDLIAAELWSVNVADALLLWFSRCHSKSLSAIEQALVLHELAHQFNLSQTQLAQRVGRSPSWVSYRLQLIHTLPDSVLDALLRTTISPWSATRIFAPFARANAQHCEQVLQYLAHHPQSTRAIKGFYQHYQTSNRRVRQQIIAAPELFFKAQHLRHLDKLTHPLAAGPEDHWHNTLTQVKHLLKKLPPLIPHLFPAVSATPEDNALRCLLTEVDEAVQSIKQQLKETSACSLANSEKPSCV